MHPLNFFRFFPHHTYDNANTPERARSRLIGDTIFGIAASAFSLLGANLVERDSPGFAAVLRCVPALAAAIWIIRRLSCGRPDYQGVNEQYHTPTYVHETIHVPTPSYVSTPTYVHRPPVYVPPPVISLPMVHQPMYTLPHQRPGAIHPPHGQSHTTYSAPSFPSPNLNPLPSSRTHLNGMHDLPTQRVNFPSVTPTPPRNVTFTPQHQAPVPSSNAAANQPMFNLARRR
ncbi:hypothetical protein [Candidatus Protochlamydia phocaeensis]|uniref:hypothetical protein n=1 Tax=Candidatus Protochlamydia phocaeensis TaxID=1414722 RepID=UPI000837AD0F|nr:hypothetical protein [Candidatus Protochlamydia phocaeensis]